MYVVMELLGDNLTKLRQKCVGGHLSLNTVARLGVQVVDGLEILHGLEFLHRHPHSLYFKRRNTEM